MWIMIAGPYRTGASSEEQREHNWLVLNLAAYEVFRKGHVALVGVNMALPIVRAMGEPAHGDIMTSISLALADRCDAVLRIGGPSIGADEEVERIRARGGNVYRSIDEIPDEPGSG